MIKFAEVFPESEIVASLTRQLSWTHFLQLMPIKDPRSRMFYIHATVTQGWSVRELRQRIEQKTFECTFFAPAKFRQLVVHLRPDRTRSNHTPKTQ